MWPCIAPFIDRRSLGTAEELLMVNDNDGHGHRSSLDLDTVYDALGRNSLEMSKLANGLSRIRLEKKVKEVEREEEEEEGDDEEMD